METLAVRIWHLRTKRRMNLEELAERSHLSFETVWRIEQGRIKEPGLYTAAKLAEALGCTIDYLAGMHEK